MTRIVRWEDWVNKPIVPAVERKWSVSSPGPECGRGVKYAETGSPVASGTKGVVRKISTRRKHRGMASG
jgi:hypothetical protein